ncbi:MAG: glycerol-3-phosphate dehydrogenase [Wenzhouxiangellaceae bacterium]|nr:glycerol-3-phosphate dehydrogenase [Wenzhouxiangellaceae bacterium]
MASISYDLFVIGGGINGCGIARDAVGRGLKVGLCEKDDLAAHTSSASTKLIHGGLRYLEQYEFGLVRKSLLEREVLLHAAPHIIWPLTFVLPHHRGLRPAWMLRAGLKLYDLLGGRSSLPRSRAVNLDQEPFAGQLDPQFKRGFAYSDCWVEDARLVVLNAIDARERGADILTRTRCTGLERDDKCWRIELTPADGEPFVVESRVLVNAAGPWVGEIARRYGEDEKLPGVRLVKGSHIVVPKLYEGEHAWLFQNDDGRVVFAIPYEGDYTLIGTTEVQTGSPEDDSPISDDEEAYLCRLIGQYFNCRLSPEQIIWRYSGVRPLYDDNTHSASKVTRDYVLELDTAGAPVLSVYGGKLTTYRKLAEQVLARLEPLAPAMGPAWTDQAALPGGEFAFDAFEHELQRIQARYPFLPAELARRLFRAYGTRIERVLGNAETLDDLGRDFGAGLFEAELRYLVAQEFASGAEDVLWRRSKLGLHMTADQRQQVADWFAADSVETSSHATTDASA